MPSENPMRGLMIAAPQSGSGKTVVTLGLLRALKRRGVAVSPAKAGPDYIDPAFHAIACGSPSVNLDPWAMADQRIHELVASRSGDHLVVEAMMGLYDGAADGSGSAADLAVKLGIPVLLVVDAARQSHSIAALVRGFRDFRTDLRLAGVILNRVGSPRHTDMLKGALEAQGIAVLGAIRRDDVLTLPERHLGLVQAGELEGLEGFVERAADIVDAECEIDRIVGLTAPVTSSLKQQVPSASILPLGGHVAIARDAAFSFLYPHLVEELAGQGSQVSYFSPLEDEGPNESADSVYLPGGYPELHGPALSAAANFRAKMEAARQRGAAIYGECGGYMVLGEAIIDAAGTKHPMLGFLQLETSFAVRGLHLGYRKLAGIAGVVEGKNWRGHEFHYTRAVKEEGQPLFLARDALDEEIGPAGLVSDNVYGSYMHLIDRSFQ